MRSPSLLTLIKPPQFKLFYKQLLGGKFPKIKLFRTLQMPFFGRSSKEISLQRLLVMPFLLQTAAAIGLIGYLSICNGQRIVNHAALHNPLARVQTHPQAPATPIWAEPNISLQLALVLWFSTLTGALALALLTHRRMTRLLTELSQASQSIAPGSQSVSGVTRVKELSDLMQSFEQMSQEVQQLHQQVADNSQTLEHKVAERTQELHAELQRRTVIETVLQEANRELQRLAFVDGLTQVSNRRYFDQILEQEWWRLRRSRAILSIILCDIDFFKQYNDRYGHPAGDVCLRQVAHALCMAVKRPADLVTRYGGEEFAIILPNTPIGGAVSVAEDVRAQLQDQKILHEDSTVSAFVSLSIGVASLSPTASTSSAQLVAAADQALYQAKTEGRNRLIAIELDRKGLKRTSDAVRQPVRSV